MTKRLVFFGMLISILREGRSALKNLNEVLQRKRPVQLYVTDNTLNEDNIMKLTRSIFMLDDKHYFDFKEQGVYFKVNREHVDAEKGKLNPSIYIKDDHNHYFIYLKEDNCVSLQRKTADEERYWRTLPKSHRSNCRILLTTRLCY